MVESIGCSGWRPTMQTMPQRPPPDAAKLSEDLIRHADSDGDGAVSKSEFSALLQNGGVDQTDESSAALNALFDDADSDGDGALDADELTASIESLLDQMREAAPQHRPPPDEDGGPGEHFSAADTDGSGGLDATEFGEMLSAGPLGETADESLIASMFEEADSDGNGQLSEAELAGAMPPPPSRRGELPNTDDSAQQTDRLSELVQQMLAQYSNVAAASEYQSAISLTA